MFKKLQMIDLKSLNSKQKIKTHLHSISNQNINSDELTDCDVTLPKGIKKNMRKRRNDSSTVVSSNSMNCQAYRPTKLRSVGFQIRSDAHEQAIKRKRAMQLFANQIRQVNHKKYRNSTLGMSEVLNPKMLSQKSTFVFK